MHCITLIGFKNLLEDNGIIWQQIQELVAWLVSFLLVYLPPPPEKNMRDGEDSADHFVRMEKALKWVYTLTQEHLQAMVRQQKEQYDKRAKLHHFKVGQGVCLYNPRVDA